MLEKGPTCELIYPLFLFRKTLSETKQRKLRHLLGHFQKNDIPVVTAARPGGQFSIVSPATRALTDIPEYHIVDGSYYDRVDSLSSWLDQALKGLDKDHRPDVLVIQIRSFPTGSIPAPSIKGWFYQSYAPVDALLSVRTKAQLVR